MDEPTAFLTLEQLRTLAGQVYVVLLLTQRARATMPRLSTYAVRLVAVASGVALHVAIAWTHGMPPSAYALALANGAIVALSAMKTAELIKGDRPPAPPDGDDRDEASGSPRLAGRIAVNAYDRQERGRPGLSRSRERPWDAGGDLRQGRNVRADVVLPVISIMLSGLSSASNLLLARKPIGYAQPRSQRGGH